MPGPLLAVDGPFLLYRSFYALPDSILGVGGHPVNAMLGAVNVLLRIAAATEPRVIVVCFGAEAAQYRVDLYPSYHAARPPVRDGAAGQDEQVPDGKAQLYGRLVQLVQRPALHLALDLILRFNPALAALGVQHAEGFGHARAVKPHDVAVVGAGDKISKLLRAEY